MSSTQGGGGSSKPTSPTTTSTGGSTAGGSDVPTEGGVIVSDGTADAGASDTTPATPDKSGILSDDAPASAPTSGAGGGK